MQDQYLSPIEVWLPELMRLDAMLTFSRKHGFEHTEAALLELRKDILSGTRTDLQFLPRDHEA